MDPVINTIETRKAPTCQGMFLLEEERALLRGQEYPEGR